MGSGINNKIDEFLRNPKNVKKKKKQKAGGSTYSFAFESLQAQSL